MPAFYQKIRRFVILSGCLFLVSLLINSCQDQDKKVIFLEDESIEKYDSIQKWLNTPENLDAENYYKVFNRKLEEQLVSANFTKALQTLEIVTRQEMNLVKFTEELFAVVKQFNLKHGDRFEERDLAFIHYYTGNYLVNQNEYNAAIDSFRKIIDIKAEDYESSQHLAYAYSDLAFCYSAIGDQQKAMRANLESLKYFEMTADEEGKAFAYGNIALIHLFSKDYKKAEEYFNKALANYSDESNIATGLHNKILLYEETGNPEMYFWIDSTYRYFHQAEIDDKPLEIAVNSYYVKKLVHDKNLSEAAKVLEESKKIVENINSASSQDEYNIALAEFQLASNGIIDTSLILKALKAVEENEHYQNQIVFNEVLRQNAIQNKNYKKALEYSENINKAGDKLATQEMIVKTMELNEKHKAKEKEQQIKIQKQTIGTKNSTIILMVMSIFVLFLVSLIIFIRQNQKKILVENQRALTYTRQLLEKMEEERKRIASDLHDSVGHELLGLKNSKTLGDEEDKKTIDRILNDIRNISRNLHPVMFEKIGLSETLENLITRLGQSSQMVITSDIQYSDRLSVTEELQVYRIIQEALSNTVKYAKAIAAKVIITESGDGVYIKIMDNGQGFDVESELASGKSFGLHNIMERSKAIGGSAKILSTSKGTIIEISITR